MNQEQTLNAMAAQIQQLAKASPIPPVVPSPPAPVPLSLWPAPETQVGTLECYAGDPEGCNPFLANCSIWFALQPHTFSSEEANVAFTVNQWERWTPPCDSFQLFATELRKLSIDVDGSYGLEAARNLMSLRQGEPDGGRLFY